MKNKKSNVITAKPTRISGIIAVSIISMLVLNAGLVPTQQQQQAYATAAIPKTSDLKEDIKQDIGDQNTCHRGEDCEQAGEDPTGRGQ